MATEVATSMALTCGSDQYNLDGKKCCTKCPPGSGVVTQCDKSSQNTRCKPCVYSQTYSPTLSHTDGCLRCSKCPNNARPIRSCNVTHDTVCQCRENYFYDQVTRTCRPCSHCPVGWGAKQMCTGTQDTKCKECPAGTYSDRSSLEGCKVCRTCNSNQVQLQGCNHSQDTVCVDIPVHSTQPNYHVLTNKVNKSEYSENGTELIPLYCAIMGSVVVGLLVYVIVKHLRRKGPEVKRQQSHSGSLDRDYSKKNGSIADSGVCLDADMKTVCSKTRIRDLTLQKRKAIEDCFIASKGLAGGWDQLARELGYSSSKIASFELRGEHEGQQPMRFLLLEWGKSDNATVGILMRALKRINRQDVTRSVFGDNMMSPQQLSPQSTYLTNHTHSVILNAGPSGPHMV